MNPVDPALTAGTFADAVAAWRAGAHDDALHLAGILDTPRDRLAARALIERALTVRSRSSPTPSSR